MVLALGDYLNCACHACIGGTNVRADMMKLQSLSPQIIVGTPGRVLDMLKRGAIRKFHIYQHCQRASVWRERADFVILVDDLSACLRAAV